MRVSYYELYEGVDSQWVLTARFMPKDEAAARAQAESTWAKLRVPVVLTQEAIPNDGGEPEVTTIYRSPGSILNITAPEVNGSIAGRVIMAVLNGALLGAASGIVAGIATKSKGLGALVFVGVTVAASLLLFRMMVPMELMLWHNKTADTKRKTVAALAAAASEDRAEGEAGMNAQPQIRRAWRKGAFSHPIESAPTVSVGAAGAVLSEATELEVDATAAPITATASELLQGLINRQLEIIKPFVAEAMVGLGPTVNTLQAFDRYGINLYVAGAAQELAWREALTSETLQTILTEVLTEYGQSAESIRGFCERLDSAQTRPRFKAMLDAGKAAIIVVLEGKAVPQEISLASVLRLWSNPHDKAVAARRYAVLLTDMIGSTDATRKLGNSGAQRMLRGHNSIVRAALKETGGKEIKHTGDGILAIFDKAVDAVEAARSIQQDVLAYVKDNPDLPLSLRIGVEYGEGAIDGGEYFGPAFTAIEATCDAAGGGDIAVTPLVKERSAGANIQYLPLTPSPTAKAFVEGLFKLMWEPKPVYKAPPLEYRQLGATGGKMGAPSGE